MNTEIVLKDYSDISFREKIRIALVLPKYFQIIEEAHMLFSAEMAQTDIVTGRISLLESSVIVADLMSFYNSDEYKDFTVVAKTIDYLQAIKLNSKASGFKKETARLMLEQLVKLLPETVFTGV